MVIDIVVYQWCCDVSGWHQIILGGGREVVTSWKLQGSEDPTNRHASDRARAHFSLSLSPASRRSINPETPRRPEKEAVGVGKIDR